jgi:phosphonate transport system permease protein
MEFTMPDKSPPRIPTQNPEPAPLSLQNVSPRWTGRKKAAALIALFLFLTLSTLRIAVLVSGKDSGFPALIGLSWVDTIKVVAEEQVHFGSWVWPEINLFPETQYQLSLGWDALVDMVDFSALGILLTVIFGMVSMREVSRRRYLWRGARAAVLASILLYTYHSCGIDPFGVWQSRGNAWRHLAGRTFSENEIGEIRADAERSPSYFAEGEANYIIGKKYKNVPPEQTPSVFDKQKEVREIKVKLLAEMSPVQRQKIIDDEYSRLLDKKRGGYWPPELAARRLWVYFTALLETIAIAIWASLLAVICAVPLSVLAADNTLSLIAPGDGRVHRAVRWVAVFMVRRFLDSCRGFNELVMALIFVSVIGLGPFAGILALWVHTTGILGKVFSEAIEAIDPGQVEALVGTGAGSTQTISFSVMPQVMPTVISYSLLRFESNVRSAAILGWVGAGGIGFLLQDKMVGYCHREVCTMMIMIIIAVSLIDFFCGKLRRRFI